MTAPSKVVRSVGALQRAHLSLDEEVEHQFRETVEVAGRYYEFKPETRCRVCMDPSIRRTVDALLSQAMPYQWIADAMEGVNSNRPKNQRITYNSVWNHKEKHFRYDDHALAMYRDIIERRAAEHDKDFIGGMESLLGVYGFFEVVAQKAYASLIDPETVVTIETGMAAILKLHELTRKEQGAQQMAEVIQKMNRVIAAVREQCSPAQWEAIAASLDGREPHDYLDAEVLEDEDGIEPDDPAEEIEPDEDFDEDD